MRKYLVLSFCCFLLASIAQATGIILPATGGSGGSGAVDSVFGRTGVVSASPNDYTWAQINKSVSNIADITTTIAGQSAATVATGDLVLIADIDDSNVLKKVTAQAIADLVGGGTDLTGLGTDNRMARWDGTDTIQSSGITIDDSNNVTGVSALTVDDITVSSPVNVYSLSHDSFADFVADEHIDWTASSAGTIHASNYVDNDTTDHTALSNIGTNTHAQIDTAVTNSANHIANTSNPHTVTAAQVGAVADPGTSTDNAVLKWDGATGDAVQDSGLLLGDSSDGWIQLVSNGTAPNAMVGRGIDLQTSRSAAAKTVQNSGGSGTLNDNALFGVDTYIDSTAGAQTISDNFIGGYASYAESSVASDVKYNFIYGDTVRVLASNATHDSTHNVIMGDTSTLSNCLGCVLFGVSSAVFATTKGYYNTVIGKSNSLANSNYVTVIGNNNGVSSNVDSVVMLGQFGQTAVAGSLNYSYAAATQNVRNVVFQVEGTNGDLHVGSQAANAIRTTDSNTLKIHVTASNQQDHFIGLKASPIQTIDYEKTIGASSGTITGGDGAGNVGDLNSNPVDIVAAPGASTCVIVDEVQLFLDWDGSAAYDGGVSTITIQYGTSGTAACLITEDDILAATGDSHRIATCSIATMGNAGVIDMDDCDNETVQITTNVAPYAAAGTSPLKYRVIYHLETYLQ